MNSESSSQPVLPRTPPEVLGPPVRERVIVEDKTFLIERPGDSDRIMDHPEVRSMFAAQQYMPYWADLWPASRMLAKAIVRESWPAGVEALEIGCGLGLPGIAALSVGLRVAFSDCDATALEYAAANARLNGFDNFRLLTLDWSTPPKDLQVPVVLASDLLFEIRNVEPIVNLIRSVLAPEGVCLLTDQDRVPAHVLREALPASGLFFTTQVMRAGEPGGRRVKGTLYRIEHECKPTSSDRRL